MAIPQDVLAFYDTSLEDARLLEGTGALELLRTQEILGRVLPPGARVADIGGATGRYAAWLAAEGHDVDLVEPAPKQATAARVRAGEPPRFRVHVGDAARLPFADASLDAALLLGPLYHLPRREDRIAVLREASRVCRSGGAVVAAAISRFAPLLHIVRNGRIADATAWANARDETRTGRRVPLERRTTAFPDAWFHVPDELSAEIADAGLALESLIAVEGLGWLVDDLDSWLEDPIRRERILEIARLHQDEPSVLAASPHLLAVARVA